MFTYFFLSFLFPSILFLFFFILPFCCFHSIFYSLLFSPLFYMQLLILLFIFLHFDPPFYLFFFSFLILFNPCGAEGLYLLQSSQTNHFSVKIPENTSNKEMWISLKLLSSRRCPGAHWKAQYLKKIFLQNLHL